MKTIAVFFILSCLSLCLVNSERVRKWGQTDTKVLGERTLVAPAEEGKTQQITFEFPEGKKNSKIPIIGIVHLDYAEQPVAAKTVKGGPFERKYVIALESKPGYGINSTFIFHGLQRN